MRYEITSTNIFDRWLSRIKDRQAVKAILQRLARVEAGNLGDVEPVGGEVSEMRIFTGKGYRIYFTTQKNRVIVFALWRYQKYQETAAARHLESQNNNWSNGELET